MQKDLVFPHFTEKNQQFGLAKREYFAALAMQALLTGRNFDDVPDKQVKCQLEQDAQDAVTAADALIAALEDR